MKNGVTKDTESYNKRIGVKDRDARQQATEWTREASTIEGEEKRERERKRNGPALPCKAHPGIQPLKRAGEMLKEREQYLSRTEETASVQHQGKETERRHVSERRGRGTGSELWYVNANFCYYLGHFCLCYVIIVKGYEYVSSDCLDKHQHADDLLMSGSGGTGEELDCAAQAHTVPQVSKAVFHWCPLP